jgi:hypothetical protein
MPAIDRDPTDSASTAASAETAATATQILRTAMSPPSAGTSG